MKNRVNHMGQGEEASVKRDGEVVSHGEGSRASPWMTDREAMSRMT